MNLASIPAHLPFLDVLAERWLAGQPDPSRGLILLPTRRAARALAEAFLRQTGGRPVLLPRIVALGGLDEAPLALAGALDLPPAIDPLDRLAALTRLILALEGKNGAPATADRAWRLAIELAALMDEAERAEIDLAEALPQAAAAAFAIHWDITLQFLRIVTAMWPGHLTTRGQMNPAARQVRLLRIQARAWQDRPPSEPVWAAGMTGGIPAVAHLLGVIARLPHGCVVLPGLDLSMDVPCWDAIDQSHPQAGLARLLAGLGATRDDVRPWVRPWEGVASVAAARPAALGRALLPAAMLDQWRTDPPLDLSGVERLSAADQQQEAASIALVLRDALETPGARAALVTPDRELARRVSAELLRYGVVADDSAGENLAETPPAVFLRLLAAAVAEQLSPVPLLSLLKHPLAAAGLSPASCREAARRLEIAALRGPRPAPGLDGLRRVMGQSALPEVAGLLDRLESCLNPLLRLPAPASVPPVEALRALIEAAEALAASDEAGGAARLWSGEEGEALAAHLSTLLQSLEVVPEQTLHVLPGLLEASLEGLAVRSRRALRGRTETAAEHPRVFIWGLLEARLQSVDLLVLGGLAEGVWPPAADPGPWLSRPMRAAIGLPSPEERVGQAAHDFLMAACAAPRVILSCPRRRDAAPAVPARWLARLDAWLAGQGRALPVHPAAEWARALDQPDGPPLPVAPPRPCPPVALRPRRLSLTEIETWLRDPFAIHARHVLRLRPLDPLDQPADAADYGTIVHAALHRFLRAIGTAWPPDSADRLRDIMDAELSGAGLRPALTAWWRPRLRRIASWVAEEEAGRRALASPLHIATEIAGEWEITAPAGPFRLRGRADRIECGADGRLAILDYKTGTPPTEQSVRDGLAPQLPLEAAMAAAGGFGPELARETAELAYWHLSGGFQAGVARSLFKGDAAEVAEHVRQAREGLHRLVAEFDDPARPYLSRPHPGHAPRFSDYAQLARVAEWAAAEEGG